MKILVVTLLEQLNCAQMLHTHNQNLVFHRAIREYNKTIYTHATNIIEELHVFDTKKDSPSVALV